MKLSNVRLLCEICYGQMKIRPKLSKVTTNIKFIKSFCVVDGKLMVLDNIGKEIDKKYQ